MFMFTRAGSAHGKAHCCARSKLHKCLLVRRLSSSHRVCKKSLIIDRNEHLSKVLPRFFSSSSAFHSSVVKVRCACGNAFVYLFRSFPLCVYLTVFFALCQGVFPDFFCRSQNSSIRSARSFHTRRDRDLLFWLVGVSKPRSVGEKFRGATLTWHKENLNRSTLRSDCRDRCTVTLCHTCVSLSSSVGAWSWRRVNHDPRAFG